MANVPAVELLVDGSGSVNGEQFVACLSALTAKVGSEQTHAELSHPLMFTHWPKKESNSHSQFPQPPDDELEELELELDEGIELELDEGIELELELLMVIYLGASLPH